MKIIIKVLALFFTIGLLFSACSSKKVSPTVQKMKPIDTQKVKAAYKELDIELQKNK